jgi:magnesium transporter
MVKYYVKKRRKLSELDNPEPGCWVNISPPFTHEELEEAATRFGLPLDFLTDSLDEDERARYERDEDVRLILFDTPVVNDPESDIDAIYITVPIGIIITLEHVITICGYESPVLEMFAEGKVKNFNPADEKLFVLQILEQNVLRFLNSLKKLNLKRNLIEKELLDSSRNKELKQLLAIEKSLVYFVNSLSANELLKMKMKRTDFLQVGKDEETADLFEDIIIDNSQAMEMANIFTNILNGTMDAYGSIISNNLNIVMKRLTLITIVLMVPTLIASFFGMNIPLPFSTSRYALLFVFLISAGISFFLVWYFRSRRLF